MSEKKTLIEKFLVGAALKNEGAVSTPEELYHYFTLWCEEQGENSFKKSYFDKTLVAMGYSKRRVEVDGSPLRCWFGLGQVEESEEPEEKKDASKRGLYVPSRLVKENEGPHPDELFVEFIGKVEALEESPDAENMREVADHLYYQHVYGRLSMLLDQKLGVDDTAIRHRISHDITMSWLKDTYEQRKSWRDLVDRLVILCGEEDPFGRMDSKKKKELQKYFGNAKKQLSFFSRSFLPLLREACDCIIFDEEEEERTLPDGLVTGISKSKEISKNL